MKNRKKIKLTSFFSSNLFLSLLLFLGISILLYPSIADWWNSHTQSKAVAVYEDKISGMTEDEFDAEFAKAFQYNDSLSQLSDPYFGYQNLTGYNQALNVNKDGVMGYITIKKINQEIPIYHGTSTSVLNSSVGHLEGSSLPVGGPGTHAVLSAHRGLPKAKLFTDLDKMEEGDTFVLKVLNETLTYKVDQIRIVLPEEIDDLKIDPDQDYCTLVTCTPYGINTHRLLVRGVRTDNEYINPYVSPDAFELSVLILAPVIAAFILLILLIRLLLKSRKKKKLEKIIH